MEVRLQAACQAASRQRSEVTLVVVTKTWPVSDAATLCDLGVLDLGESRDQEAAVKAAAVPRARWHFIGQLQTNKAASVARYAEVVHTVDRPHLVAALSAGAVRAERHLGALVQVSLDGDPARGGVPTDGVSALAQQVASADGLDLLGVMAVAPLSVAPAEAFERLADIAARVRAEHPAARWISAGMSADLEAAIDVGATHVRVGSAILGSRTPVLG